MLYLFALTDTLNPLKNLVTLSLGRPRKLYSRGAPFSCRSSTILTRCARDLDANRPILEPLWVLQMRSVARCIKIAMVIGLLMVLGTL